MGNPRMARFLSWARGYFWPFRTFALFIGAMSGLYTIAFFPPILLSDTGDLWRHPLFPYICLGHVLTLGLWFQQKWAGLLFAAVCSLLAFEVGVLGSWFTPWPWLLLNVGAGILLALPALEVWGNWEKLR